VYLVDEVGIILPHVTGTFLRVSHLFVTGVDTTRGICLTVFIEGLLETTETFTEKLSSDMGVSSLQSCLCTLAHEVIEPLLVVSPLHFRCHEVLCRVIATVHNVIRKPSVVAHVIVATKWDDLHIFAIL